MNATQSGIQHANHVAEEEQYFASSIDNLVLVAFSDKDVINHIIASNKKLAESNKTLIDNIASMIHNGRGNMGTNNSNI